MKIAKIHGKIRTFSRYGVYHSGDLMNCSERKWREYHQWIKMESESVESRIFIVGRRSTLKSCILYLACCMTSRINIIFHFIITIRNIHIKLKYDSHASTDSDTVFPLILGNLALNWSYMRALSIVCLFNFSMHSRSVLSILFNLSIANCIYFVVNTPDAHLKLIRNMSIEYTTVAGFFSLVFVSLPTPKLKELHSSSIHMLKITILARYYITSIGSSAQCMMNGAKLLNHWWWMKTKKKEQEKNN